MSTRKSKFIPPIKSGFDIGALRQMRDAVNALLNGQFVNGQVIYSDSNVMWIGAAPAAGFSFRGEYSPSVSYAVDDVVVIRMGANAGSYVCIEANTGESPQLPDSGNLFWVSLSGNSPPMGYWMG